AVGTIHRITVAIGRLETLIGFGLQPQQDYRRGGRDHKQGAAWVHLWKVVESSEQNFHRGARRERGEKAGLGQLLPDGTTNKVVESISALKAKGMEKASLCALCPYGGYLPVLLDFTDGKRRAEARAFTAAIGVRGEEHRRRRAVDLGQA